MLCVVPLFSTAAAKNYRLVRLRKDSLKVHFRRKQALLRKVAALCNLGGEEVRQYAPKGGEGFQQGGF